MSRERPQYVNLSRKRRIYFRLIAATLGLVLALAAGEIGVRLSRTYWTPSTERAENLQYEPSLFARNILEPGQHLRRKDIDLPINNFGYRGRDFSMKKPAGTTRIVFVGGSFVFSWPPQSGQAWTERTEARLAKDGFKNVEIINAGIPSQASFDALGRFYSEIWRFQPDYAVICSAWNDIKYFADLGDGTMLLRNFAPYSHRYDPRTDYRNWLDRVLCEHSQLFVRIRQYFVSHTTNFEEEGAVPDKPAVDHVPVEGLAQYRLNLRLFADAARDAGATPIMMPEPTLATPETPLADRERIRTELTRMNYDTMVKALQACRQTALDVAAEKHTPIIDVAPQVNGQGKLFRDHVHMTSEGYEVFSQLVAQDLEKILRARAADAPTSATQGLH